MTALTGLAALMLVPATVAATVTFVLVTLGRRPLAVPPPVTGVWPKIGVLVPAHDEATSIAPTVQSVLASAYPADRVTLLVVADNCSDDTATVAARAGAEVIERRDPRRGKGYALELGTETLLNRGVDGVVVLDADCELPADGLEQFARELRAGSGAVQAARLPRGEAGTGSSVAATAGSWIENAVSAGRGKVGLPVPLRGSGMLFARDTLARVPWTAYGLVEDAEYGQMLTRAGVRVRFRLDVVVRGEVPADTRTLAKQRARWRTSLFSGGLRDLPGRWLASKPLVLAQLALATTLGLLAALTAGGTESRVLLAWLAIVMLLTAGVYAPAARRAGGWRAAVPAVGVVCRLALVTLGGLGGQPKTWERTRRAAEG